MCGLYSNLKPADEVRNFFKYKETPQFPPRRYIAPASPIGIVRTVQGERHFALVRWGLVPGWSKEIRPGKPLINARAETVTEKPSFRGAMKYRRCIIPADGFYEWSGMPGHKQAWYIHRPDSGLFGFAGLWEYWMSPDGSELESAAIITMNANETVGRIHDRMPVILTPESYGKWLDMDGTNARDAAALLTGEGCADLVAETTTIERPKKRREAPPKPQQPSLF